MSTLTRRFARFRTFRHALVQATLSGVALFGAASLSFGAYQIFVHEAAVGIFAVPLGLTICALACDEIRRNARAR